jgi:PAS domain S-box-containing protein
MDDLLNTAPCGFLSFADDGMILMVNATLAALLGHDRDELQGRHIESILPIASRIFYQTHFFPLLKMHGKVEELYLSLRSKSGDDVPVLVNAVRRERAGTVVNDCVFVPMHQRNRYEDEILQAKKAAEEANQAKSRFLSVMSHELRTPLTVIQGYSDILSSGMRGPVTQFQLDDLGRIQKASQSLLGLINDILGFARLEIGQVDLKIETVLVEAALARSESLLTLRLQEAGLEYVRAGCASEVAVRADPERLQQILLNLLTNAIKFTDQGGRVSTACERSHCRTLIHVRDSGRGIPHDRINGIFDPFVQVDREQIESRQRGVGLGLAISRDLARAMGGDLTVESTVGQGSVFTIALPTAGPSDQA